MNSSPRLNNGIAASTDAGYYRNFRQPFKLAWRMLTSRNRAALAAISHLAMKSIAMPVDWLLSGKEKQYQSKEFDPSLPIVLVVGAPRSGTTLIYQTLARCCEISYFTNLTAMFPRSPLTATRFFSGNFRSHQTSFESFYGYMPKLTDPNDGFLIWNRWLGTDRYAALSELSEEAVMDMRHFFRAWTQTFGLPFLNKNNRNTMCVDLLAEALPEAHFVVVRRDPLYVAQSLIHARETIQGDKRAKWGLQSRNVYAALEPLGYIDDICDQLIEIEHRLQSQLDKVDPTRFHLVQYEKFCSQPKAFLESLANSIPGMELNRKAMETQLGPFEASKRESVSNEELHRINKRFAEVRMCA